MRWKARLSGHEFDLQTLKERFGNGTLRVIQEEDGYFLTSEDFEDLPDAAVVKTVAQDVLTQMNGATRVLNPSHRLVKLGNQFIEVESRVHSVLNIHSAEHRHRADVVVVVADGEVPPSVPPPRGPSFMDLERTNKNVADGFRLLGKGDKLDWFGLYKLLEIVKSDVGGEAGIVREGWASRDELHAFGASANRADASGDGARHARNTGGLPKRTLQLVEARELILRVVNQWIEWRASAT